jgi:hypothetical protein
MVTTACDNYTTKCSGGNAPGDIPRAETAAETVALLRETLDRTQQEGLEATGARLFLGEQDIPPGFLFSIPVMSHDIDELSLRFYKETGGLLDSDLRLAFTEDAAVRLLRECGQSCTFHASEEYVQAILRQVQKVDETGVRVSPEESEVRLRRAIFREMVVALVDEWGERGLFQDTSNPDRWLLYKAYRGGFERFPCAGARQALRRIKKARARTLEKEEGPGMAELVSLCVSQEEGGLRRFRKAAAQTLQSIKTGRDASRSTTVPVIIISASTTFSRSKEYKSDPRRSPSASSSGGGGGDGGDDSGGSDPEPPASFVAPFPCNILSQNTHHAMVHGSQEGGRC